MTELEMDFAIDPFKLFFRIYLLRSSLQMLLDLSFTFISFLSSVYTQKNNAAVTINDDKR